jgi:DNA mismatch repair ATPase MutS
LKRVERIASALGLRTNPILWFVVHAFVPWDFYFTYRLEFLKEDVARLLPGWLDAWYEIEALNSLANFAYLQPHYVFPDIVSKLNMFDAEALGHPLIKPEFKVCNDFEIGKHNKISILTGSNMAGKSTFIRTVGINLCLAYSGAPVNANRLAVSVFRIFTCIKVSDSVQDGLSYFYAEVKRLKSMLSVIEEEGPPVLFLIDEIYRGTNSRERHIGSHALIRALSNRTTAVGIIATHDLELVTLADEIPGVTNFHLRDEVQHGKMVFDYLMRKGPSPTTNALKLMQMEGLPVEI